MERPSRGWSRRAVLASVAAVGAGCLDSPGGTTQSAEGREAEPSAAPDGTPTAAPGSESTRARTETAEEPSPGTGAATETDEEPDTPGYERRTVVAYDANGTELATVKVRVADTSATRYTGLGDTDSLAPDEGMWFVHPEERRQGYVMRGMSFPLDIVFVDASGTVTRVVHADVAGTGAPYEARAKYVLEVNRGWANRTGLDVGDRVLPA